MKKNLLPILALMLCTVSAQAQSDNEFGAFDHLGAGVSVGLDGIGVDLAAPITDWAGVRAGISFFPKIKYSDEVHVTSPSSVFTNRNVDVEGKLNIFDVKMLFDLYPIRSSSFHITAGAFIGPKKVVQAYNTEEFLKREEWGVSGVKLGDYRITSDDKGNVEANIEVAGFKPYVGIGFGRAVPRNNIGFSVDLGVKFWGSPGVYAWTTDNFGERTYSKLKKSDVDDADDDDASKAFDTISKINVFPVLTFRLSGKLF